MPSTVHITVWNEFLQEKTDEPVRKLYPDGMHVTIANHLNAQDGITAGTATLADPEHGLTDEVLVKTDVLIWWGHRAHHEVNDEIVERVASGVRGGMGLIVLHSAHFSKPFVHLMGTSCRMDHWDENGKWEKLWLNNPTHPIVEGIKNGTVIPETEMYSEPFDVPQPDELILTSSFESGEVFRSGCVWNRGKGKVFYFRPGHETYPIFYDPNVMRVITNACRWLASGDDQHRTPNIEL
ncbi:MAG: ThuA domain-containing protein [Verrucomicrobia bacterium]|nr:ThuA domain-containing protein [Verrucomicrobiota bacterium]